MRKISSLLFCLCFLVLSATAASAQRQTKSPRNNDDWVGEYRYTYTESKTGSGWAPIVEHLLIVSKKGDSLVAHFTADGYQTYDDYSYTAKAEGDHLNLYFLKDLQTNDAPGTERHLTKGQLVGSLVKTVVRGKVRYQYKDGAYEISYRPQNPVYFKKTK